MRKNTLDIERSAMLTEYIGYINSSSINYDYRGRYIDAVFLFLTSTDEVSRRGWNKWRKNNAEVMVYKPFIHDAICDFLAFRGIGFKNAKKLTPKKRNIDIEKREIREKDIINKFTVWLQNDKEYSPNTLRIYIYTAMDYFSYFDELTNDNARSYIAALEKKGNKPKTIRLRITSLEKLGIFLNKPIKLKHPKIVKTLSIENIPTKADYMKIISFCDDHNPKWSYIIRLLGTTGCRVSELIQFTYEDIKKGSVDIKGKGNKYRRFFFTKQLMDEAEGKHGYVCVNRFGNVISTRGIAQWLKKIGEKCRIDSVKMHPHAFRHFFAKMYLNKTKDVISLADILGHSSVDTTRIYLQKSYVEQQMQYTRTVDW